MGGWDENCTVARTSLGRLERKTGFLVVRRQGEMIRYGKSDNTIRIVQYYIALF